MIDSIYIICFFILGICMGSFYHVVGFRLPKGESIFKPKHSYCPECQHQLKVGELIPILSYLWQRGKCKNCKKKISVFYPFIELITGILFSLCFYSFGFTSELLIALILSSVFVIVVVSDIEYLMIPDEVTYTAIVLIVIIIFFSSGMKTGLLSIGSGICLFLLMYGFMLLGNFLFKKESLGGADVKLMFLVGVSTTPFVGFFVLFLSSLTALPVSLVLLQKKNERAIPFGPFIMLSLLLFFLMKIDTEAIVLLLKNM